MPRHGAVASLSAALLVLVGGCTDAAPERSPAPGPASASAPAAGPVPTRTFWAGGDRMTMAVPPLTRSGGVVVLTAQTRVDESLSGVSSASATMPFSARLSVDFDGARLVDEAAGRVYQVARDPATTRCVCSTLFNVELGATVPLQAAFTGIPAGVTKLSVMLPNAGAFTDIPVIDAPAPAPAASSRNGPEEPLNLAVAGPSATGLLTAYSDRLDAPVTTTRTQDRVDIALSADVLFRVDKADLTPAAAKSIAAAVAELRQAGAGPLTVTGHTDNNGTTDHNQTLSERRAATVAAALDSTLPQAQWPRTVVGKGETAPVVRNDSDAHRRLNRRVTISYQARAAAPAPAAAEAAPTIPETTGVRGKAPEGVRVTLDSYRSKVGAGHGTVQIVPQSATRRGDYLLVYLLARNTGTDEATIWDYFGGGVFAERDANESYTQFGATGIRLLNGNTALYPLDYETEKYIHSCLCDKYIGDKLPAGSERLLPLWYPAPPAGTATITIDLPNRFRITDVPIA